MNKKVILAALVVAILLTTVVTAYAASWHLVQSLTYQYAYYQRFTCNTLIPYTGYAYQRVRIVPLSADVDLYVYGYRSSWVLIGSSTYGGTTADSVMFTSATRNYYSTIIACAWGYNGSSYYHQYHYLWY